MPAEAGRRGPGNLCASGERQEPGRAKATAPARTINDKNEPPGDVFTQVSGGIRAQAGQRQPAGRAKRGVSQAER